MSAFQPVVSRRRPPNRTREFLRIRLSMSRSGGLCSCERLLDALEHQLFRVAPAASGDAAGIWVVLVPRVGILEPR